MILPIIMLEIKIRTLINSELKGLHKNVQNFYSKWLGSQEIQKKNIGGDHQKMFLSIVFQRIRKQPESRFLRDPGIPNTRRICTKVGRMLEKRFKLLVITYKKVP